MKSLILIATCLFALSSAGCPEVSPYAGGIIAPTGTDIDKADAFNSSAESATAAAIPHADPAGKAALSIAAAAHKAVAANLTLAKSDLAGVQKRVGVQDKTITDLQNTVVTIKNGWGYRLQVWVAWAWFVLKILIAIFIAMAIFHLIAGPVSMLLPPPWNAFVLTAGNWCNPFGWISIVLQRMHTNAVAAQATSTITIQPGQNVANVIANQVASQPQAPPIASHL